MKVTTQTKGEDVYVQVEGRIDTTNSIEFENTVSGVLTPEVKQIYLDCSGLNYISSSGLRVLLTFLKKLMAAGGTLKLYSLQPSIKEIFDISGFSTIFPIYTDLVAAQENQAG